MTEKRGEGRAEKGERRRKGKREGRREGKGARRRGGRRKEEGRAGGKVKEPPAAILHLCHASTLSSPCLVNNNHKTNNADYSVFGQQIG